MNVCSSSVRPGDCPALRGQHRGRRRRRSRRGESRACAFPHSTARSNRSPTTATTSATGSTIISDFESTLVWYGERTCSSRRVADAGGHQGPRRLVFYGEMDRSRTTRKRSRDAAALQTLAHVGRTRRGDWLQAAGRVRLLRPRRQDVIYRSRCPSTIRRVGPVSGPINSTNRRTRPA